MVELFIINTEIIPIIWQIFYSVLALSPICVYLIAEEQKEVSLIFAMPYKCENNSIPEWNWTIYERCKDLSWAVTSPRTICSNWRTTKCILVISARTHIDVKERPQLRSQIFKTSCLLVLLICWLFMSPTARCWWLACLLQSSSHRGCIVLLCPTEKRTLPMVPHLATLLLFFFIYLLLLFIEKRSLQAYIVIKYSLSMKKKKYIYIIWITL